MTQRKPTKSATSKSAAAKPATAKAAKPRAPKAAAAAAAATAEAPARPAKPAPGDDGGLAVALKALELALDKKALEPVLLDVRDLCGYCNYQLVLSGRSERQVEAISDGVVMGLRDDGLRPLGTEGKRSGQWSLLDFGDVVVHVFNHSLREHYDLEGLWNDAPRVAIDIPDDARIPADQY